MYSPLPRDYILIANFVGMALLPFLLLALANFKLYATIKVFLSKWSWSSDIQSIDHIIFFQESGRRNQKTSHRQKRDRQIASLLILLVIVFGSCNIVRVIMLMLGLSFDLYLFFFKYTKTLQMLHNILITNTKNNHSNLQKCTTGDNKWWRGGASCSLRWSRGTLACLVTDKDRTYSLMIDENNVILCYTMIDNGHI